MIRNTISSIKNYYETFSTMNTVWGDTLSFLGIVLILASLFSFRRKMNKITSRKIKDFEKDGKYIEELFIELNTTKEFLRYFVFKNSWKKRIVKQFNTLYKRYPGTILLKITKDNEIKYKLTNKESIEEIIKNITFHQDLHKALKKDNPALFKKYFIIKHQNTLETFIVWSYFFVKTLEEIKGYSEAIKERFIILKGSAGNGKTSMICSLSKIIMRNSMPCILIDSRDITMNAEEYFEKLVSLKLFSPLFRILDWWYFISGRSIFVIVDAINENDSTEFHNSISTLVNTLMKYKSTRVILTCRNEYFENRYELLFKNNLTVSPYIYDIKSTIVTDRALDRMVYAYSKHYRFGGKVSENVANQIFNNSLLFLRMFFETHSDFKDHVMTLNKFQIYQKYINELDKKYENINVKGLIERLTNEMLSGHKFDQVFLSKINITPEETKHLRQIADENILITRKIQKHKNTIAEKEEELFLFTFDEMRDYCLAHNILAQDLDIHTDKNKNFPKTFELLDFLYSQKLSPTEGVERYAYQFFKKNGYSKECEKILTNYTAAPVQSWKEYRQTRRPFFDDALNLRTFGLSLIMECNMDLLYFEKKYIFDIIKKPYEFHNFFKYLYSNEKYGGIYSLKIILTFLTSLSTFKELDSLVTGLKNSYREPTDRENILDCLAPAGDEETLAKIKLLLALPEDDSWHYVAHKIPKSSQYLEELIKNAPVFSKKLTSFLEEIRQG